MEDQRAMEYAWALEEIKKGHHVEPGPYLSKQDIDKAKEAAYWEHIGGKPAGDRQSMMLVELIKARYGLPLESVFNKSR